jgi:hypothetical protein
MRVKPRFARSIGVKAAHATGTKKAEAVSLGLERSREISRAA